VTAVNIAVWGNANGQNDLKWYAATKQGATSNWSVVGVPISAHAEAGVYNVHAYGTLLNGQSVFLGSSTFTVTSPQTSVSAVSIGGGSYRISGSAVGGTIPSGVSASNIQIAVWSNVNGQDDLRWYSAQGSGANWYIDVNKANHKGNTGAYSVHVYFKMNNGINVFAGSTQMSVS
jgi:hypothetical protein